MGTEEWHADIEITIETVKNFLREQFASLTPIKNIQYLGEGWDNKLFLVNQEIIFRFPRRKAAIELMKRENLLLKNLPVFSDIKTPLLEYMGQSSALHPYPCQGYRIIKGDSGYQANLSDQDREASIITLATFLKQLHSINENDARAMGVIPQESGSRTNITETIKILKERINKLTLHKIININMTCLQNEITIAQKLILPDERCFVHGDLDGRHLIFENKKLTGIIDWGDTDITNRSADLDVIWSFFPENCHKKFFEIYGTVEADTWKYARFLGLYTAFSLMLYGNDLKDNMLFAESIESVKRINPELII